jgi:hypothetical protein
MSQPSPQPKELEELQKAFSSETKAVNIRLREGEYQLSLAKAIASSELQLRFPDVKDLAGKLFGEEKTKDLQFVSKIQTILKKMVKSDVIKIIPKEKPWELQRYALSSFKFQDVEKNLVILATNSEIDKTLQLIDTKSDSKPALTLRPSLPKSWIPMLVFIIIGSYTAIIWDLNQTTTNLIVFGLAFCVASACSILLATVISKRSRMITSK